MFLGIVFYPVLRFLYKKHNTGRRSLCKTGKADVTLPAGSGVSTTLKRLSGSMTVDLDGVSVKYTNSLSGAVTGGSNVHTVDSDIASGSVHIHN